MLSNSKRNFCSYNLVKPLACDGCNASVHEICYGVHEIPEGDFYCDRCRKVQELVADESAAFDINEARTAIMCCLCPHQHGALKPTNDGRWVHLCCAIWQPAAIIPDLSDMVVDVSQVLVQAVHDGNPVASKGGKRDTQKGNFGCSPYKDPCVYCKVQGGAVTSCCRSGCNVVFHPLCAWFNGEYISARITDETFQGQQRQGIYPSGVASEFFCDLHSPTGH